MTSIPDIQPGDQVYWHCDTVHSVEQLHSGQKDSSIFYIPAVPLSAKTHHTFGTSELISCTVFPLRMYSVASDSFDAGCLMLAGTSLEALANLLSRWTRGPKGNESHTKSLSALPI
ncbi:hypothetical protein BDR05DRAFT_969383, partial [Suillus weaverae]